MFASSFFAQLLGLVTTEVLGHVGDITPEESVVLEDHGIFVGNFIIKKFSTLSLIVVITNLIYLLYTLLDHFMHLL